MRSRDDTQFRSATFELFLHEALRRQGFSLGIHPKLQNGNSNRPDFLVSDQNGESFYLEAVLATENNNIDKGGELRKGFFLDNLSTFPHRNFMILIDGEGSPKTPPSASKLRRKIHRWLDSLEPDLITKKITNSGIDSIDPLQWDHDGWSLKIRPVPLKREYRGMSSSLIGGGSMEGGYVDAWSPIRDAIKFKGWKYGILDFPLVIAVNLNSIHLDTTDEMQALYGQELHVISPDNPNNQKVERIPNGVWRGKSGPEYTRVSAAWIFNDLQANSLANVSNNIYFNPWASSPAPESLKRFPYAFPENDKMKWFDGLSFREIFGLHKGWPS